MRTEQLKIVTIILLKLFNVYNKPISCALIVTLDIEIKIPINILNTSEKYKKINNGIFPYSFNILISKE